jgi:hypothetical protein
VREPVSGATTGGRVDARDLERLVGLEGREDRRKAARQHRLPRVRILVHSDKVLIGCARRPAHRAPGSRMTEFE